VSFEKEEERQATRSTLGPDARLLEGGPAGKTKGLGRVDVVQEKGLDPPHAGEGKRKEKGGRDRYSVLRTQDSHTIPPPQLNPW